MAELGVMNPHPHFESSGLPVAREIKWRKIKWRQNKVTNCESGQMKRICVLWLEMVFFLTSNLKVRRTVGKCFLFFPWHISSVFRGLIDFLYYYSVCGVVWGLVIEYIWGKLSHESKYPGSPFSEYFNSISTNSSISSPHLYSASKDWESEKKTLTVGLVCFQS